MKDRYLLGMITLTILVGVSLGCARQKKGKQIAADFEGLRKQVLAGDYDKTIPKLESFIKDNPKTRQASRAGLFLFKCYFAQDDLENARKWCDWTIKNHPNSLEANKCKFKLALITLVEGNPEQAKTEFEALAKNKAVPQSPESKRIVQFLESYSITRKK